jgi:hypothetical protein
MLLGSCSQNNRDGQPRINEVAFFRRFEIRTDPIRVFDEIPKHLVLKGQKCGYIEATFDGRGLIERLRLIAGSNAVWEARYQFYDTKKISSETWMEPGMTRTRFMSASGTVTNEIHQIAVSPEVPRSIGLCFDSLLAWQSGDTNEFHRLLHESEYDSQLRDVVRNSIKKGSDDEVLRWVNLFLNNWIVVEAGHSRNYEWPDSETDRTAWELLSRIHTNRQQYPCSTGDIGVDATIKRILDKTSEKDSSGHKGTTP